MVDSKPGSGPDLLRYFKLCRKDFCRLPLPNPTGPLSEKVDSAAIEEAALQAATAYQLLGLPVHFYIQVTRQRWVSNYLDRHRNLECN